MSETDIGNIEELNTGAIGAEQPEEGEPGETTKEKSTALINSRLHLGVMMRGINTT